MIIVDPDVWIDHFRQLDITLVALLTEGRPRMHPFVLGELALANIDGRSTILKLVGRLQPAEVASASIQTEASAVSGKIDAKKEPRAEVHERSECVAALGRMRS